MIRSVKLAMAARAAALGGMLLLLFGGEALGQKAQTPAKPKPPVQKTDTAPAYFVIPFEGTVGKELVAEKVKEAMAAGLKDKGTVLVLEFDSPGGLISECEAILALLAEQRDRRSIALIKRAYSAAAILAMTCDEIYMLQNSSIGCSQAISITAPAPVAPQTAPSPTPTPSQPDQPPQGSPQVNPPVNSPSPPPAEKPASGVVITEAHEKIQSVWRSICRRAAELGGHNPLLAEAMADPDIQIRLVDRDGKKVVEQFLEVQEDDLAQNRILKSKGKLLTLTGREAVICGLAAAVIGQLSDIQRSAPGLAGWKPVNDRGEKIMDTYRLGIEKSEKSFKELVVKLGDELRLAVLDDPSKKTYATDDRGNLTQGGYDLLVKQCTKCAGHLNACEQALKRIAELGKSNPFLAEESKVAQERRTEIRAARERVREFAKRFRLPPMKKLGL